MDYITATLELCTLYKGVPHGLALITYTDPNDKRQSFRGVGVFFDGHLHNAPFSCLTQTGIGLAFSEMRNGRPADASHSI